MTLKTLVIAHTTAVLVDRTQRRWLLCDLDNSFFLVQLSYRSPGFVLVSHGTVSNAEVLRFA